MLDQILIVAGLTALVMISPGPDMIIVMRNTLLGGRRAGLETALGVLLGNLVHITYCAIGIGWLISQSLLAFSLLRYAGAAYLIYLGIMSFRTAARKIELEPAAGEVRRRAWVLQGLFNNILNPKGTLFYLGVFTMVITPETGWSAMGLLVAVMMGISAGFWLIFVQTLDLRLVRKSLESSQRAVARVFGALLIALGLRVALSGS
ncbi:LysE family translocator [Stappia indica]|uniref:LysE family translocator n=1 Tax=Stappia indica TaxID=538381 RepID=UPI001CD70043|nr:LysE family transporter [Stappia indica]MCA1298438.1 LysE family transporter [Stappia indica]